jgi:hypothetical protein
MSDDEIIEEKSKEITRLHKICQAKDQVVREALKTLLDLQNQETSPYIKVGLFQITQQLFGVIG